MSVACDQLGAVAADGVGKALHLAIAHRHGREHGQSSARRRREQDSRPVARPADRIEDRRRRNELRRPAVGIHQPDAPATAAVRDERDPASVGREGRMMIAGRSRGERTGISRILTRGPQVAMPRTDRAEDDAVARRIVGRVEISTVTVGERSHGRPGPREVDGDERLSLVENHRHEPPSVTRDARFRVFADADRERCRRSAARRLPPQAKVHALGVAGEQQIAAWQWDGIHRASDASNHSFRGAAGCGHPVDLGLLRVPRLIGVDEIDALPIPRPGRPVDVTASAAGRISRGLLPSASATISASPSEEPGRMYARRAPSGDHWTPCMPSSSFRGLPPSGAGITQVS